VRNHLVAAWLAAVVAAAVVVVPAPARATPIDDALGQAASIERGLIVNGERIDALSEQYDGAQVRRAQALHEIEVGTRAVEQLRRQHTALGDLIRRRSADLYRGAGRLSPLDDLSPTNFAARGRHRAYVAAAAQRDQAMIDRYVRVVRELDRRGQRLDQYRARAAQEAVLAGMAKAKAVDLEATQEALLARVQGTIGDALRLRQAASDPAAADLEARLRLLGVDALPAPPSPPARLAVAYAIAQLGKPYVFAAAGPDTFDCSGLTLMAWKQAGVSMAHFAATQYALFPRVSIDALAPGDLVFFGATIHHVGIYIGGGKMIHAPHTGDVVRVASIYRSSLVGAVRPG
jgi:cell wall-associated NlpC family hydrolase